MTWPEDSQTVIETCCPLILSDSNKQKQFIDNKALLCNITTPNECVASKYRNS